MKLRVIFCAPTYGKGTENPLPPLNLLDILIVKNVYQLHALKFANKWQRNKLPKLLHSYLQYASDTHSYNIRHSRSKNFFKNRVRKNLGKQLISFQTTDIWGKLLPSLKQFSDYTVFQKEKKYQISSFF